MAIYGASLMKSPTKEVNFAYETATTSLTTVVGDLLSLSSGLLILATNAPTRIVGICAQAVTSAAAGAKLAYTPIDQDYEFLMGSDSALTQAAVGQYTKLTGSTGAMQVAQGSLNASPAGLQVVITKIDPLNEGDNTKCLVKFVDVTNTKI